MQVNPRMKDLLQNQLTDLSIKAGGSFHAEREDQVVQ